MHQNKRKREGQKVIAMVCHCSRLANNSSILSEKKRTSSCSRRPCTKLWVTHPLLPWAYVLTLANASKGFLSSLKVVCQPTSGREEDATFVLTWAISQEAPAGSQIMIPPDAREGSSEEHYWEPWKVYLQHATSSWRGQKEKESDPHHGAVEAEQ